MAPLVTEAVDLVNAQLASHGMRLGQGGTADFVGGEDNPDGFGADYELHGGHASRSGVGYDGSVFVTGDSDTLWVGGVELRLRGLAAHKVADATAEAVKRFLERA